MPPPIYPDMVGMKFNHWTVVRRLASRGPGRLWLCRCICGRESRLESHLLTASKIKSCGCKNQKKIKHGHAPFRQPKTATYGSWQNMRTRVSNPKRYGADRYAGRGIQCCERWNSFENFLADMGERPVGMSLNRLNNDYDYTPVNCRWATQREQCLNRAPKRWRNRP